MGEEEGSELAAFVDAELAWEAVGGGARLGVVRRAPGLELLADLRAAGPGEAAASAGPAQPPVVAVVRATRGPRAAVGGEDGGVNRILVAKTPIRTGTLVEQAHCLRVRKQDGPHLDGLGLRPATFACTRAASGDVLLPCSHMVFATPSPRPNLEYRVDQELQVVRFYAARDIAVDEVLTLRTIQNRVTKSPIAAGTGGGAG